MNGLTVTDGLDARDASRVALIAGGATWSFAELAQRANATARRFGEMGIGPGARVALVAAPAPEVFLAIHALAAIGATLVPIHPRLSPAEVAVALEVAAADVVLGAGDLFADEPLPIAAPRADASLAEAHRSKAPFAIVSTSGTTGRPKGAVLSRRAILASAAASATNLGWQTEDRWLCCMPLAHVGGLSVVTRCLLSRRAVVLLPRFDAEQVLGAILQHAVTLLSVVPTMLRALLEADTRGALRLPRALLLGGAAAPPDLLDVCAERGVRALTTYGLTEACSQVTSQAPRDPGVRLRGSGAPLAGFDLRIASESGAPLEPRRVGRILVRGPALFDGYVLPGCHSIDPARTPEGFFDTGDLGELDERGHLHVHVRRTDLVVTGGENVYPVEVEQVLERCPGVRRALVFGVPDARWGQLVAAAIELDPRSSFSREALAELLSAALAGYKRPKKIALVDEMPLTASGKVDRRDALLRFGGALAPFP
jgi:o-succinylbenzoate---CoA ligase